AAVSRELSRFGHVGAAPLSASRFAAAGAGSRQLRQAYGFSKQDALAKTVREDSPFWHGGSLAIGGQSMTRFERRSVLMAGGVIALGMGLPCSLRASSAPAGVFVVDRRFAISEAAGRDRRACGALVVDPRDEDLGIGWRGAIPSWLNHNLATLEGVTLWSDFVICEALARTFGLRRAAAPTAFEREEGLHHWLLSRERGNIRLSGLPI
ncbi:MAG TPA: hypothetical protein VFS49_12900, partial [Croceibacterium sp.]|nr:hypothetical protein [Croceibacterium sp.]